MLTETTEIPAKPTLVYVAGPIHGSRHGCWSCGIDAERAQTTAMADDDKRTV